MIFLNGKCFFLAKESLPASQNNPASFQYQDKNNHKKDTTANKHAKQTSGGHVGRRCNRTGMRLQLLNTTRHAIKQQPGMRTTSENEETKTKRNHLPQYCSRWQLRLRRNGACEAVCWRDQWSCSPHSTSFTPHSKTGVPTPFRLASYFQNGQVKMIILH